jgi:transcriptional regulator with XRE-family HTH domain
MDLNTAVGHTLRRIREKDEVTLRTVSTRASVALSHLSDIERGTKCPSLPIIETIWTVGLNRDVSNLMKEIYITLKENQ